MGAATLRRGHVALAPRTLPSVSGAEHQRALTDLRREMGLEVLKAKQEGGLTQEDVDAAVDVARKVAEGNLATWQADSDEALKDLEAKIEEQQARIDAQQERIDAMPDDATPAESDSVPDAAAEPPAEHPTQGMNADDAIDHLIGLETVEEVEALKAAELAGKNRKGVLAEVEKHVAFLNEPD